MSEYVDFHYMPLEGKITGEQVLKQTEDAINDLGNKVYSLDIDQSEIDEAIEKSNEAVNTANSALSAVTTGRSVWFNNVAEMIADDIEAGVTAETKGYYVANDGGNALYLIRQEKSGDVVDGGSLIALNNGNMAELVTDGTVNVKQFGAIGNGTDDDTTVFQNTSSYAQANGFVPFVGVATYKITSNVTGTFHSFGEVTITGGGTVDIINLQEVVSDVSDIRDEVVDETANARIYAENAQTSAINASNSASSASTTATQLMEYLEDKEELTAPAVDPTLSIGGAAADAQVTGEKISNIENVTYPELFSAGADLTVMQTIDGYGLLANGGRHADASYAIDIYRFEYIGVSEGDLLYLKLSADTAGVFQFQNNGGITVDSANPYVVGGVHTSAYDGFIVVPQGATFLVVSRNANRTDDVVAKTTSNIDEINAEIVAIQGITDYFETHLIGENLAGNLEVGYYYNQGIKTSAAHMTSAWIDVDGIIVINASGRKIADSTWSGVEMWYICSYDADKQYIPGSMDNSGYRQYTVPDGAKFLTVSFFNITYDEFTVVAGTKRPVRYVHSYEKTILMPSHYGVWYGKKWAAMGDSLTEYNDKNTKNYIEYISEATGITPVNLGVSGTGYRRGINNNNSFYNRVNTIPNDCDVFTIFGSFNDLGDGQVLGTINDDISDDTVFGYVNATLDAIYTAIPTINIGIIAPTPWKNTRPWDDTETGSLYVNGLKQICYNRGIPFLDLYHCSNLRPWDATARNLFYSNDVVEGVNAGCHPDSAGHKMIAPKIKNFLDSLIISGL